MTDSKLLKVMDYLVDLKEDQAKELLHQIFIEKARAIHEELMANEDEDMLGGDEGEELGKEIEHNKAEIDAEEHYGDGTMEDMDIEDAVEDLGGDDEEMEDADDVSMDDEHIGDEDMGDEDEAEVEDHNELDAEKLHDLEQAIEELKAEFEALKADEEGESHDEDMPAGDEEAAGEEEEEMEEGWMDDDLDEDFDSLEENVDLDTVAAAKGGEVGSGKFAPADTNKRSPVPATQADTMGARPVVTGKGPKAAGFDLEKAPASHEMPKTASVRKKVSDGMSHVSKEGDASAKLNKGTSDGFGAEGKRSPLGSGTTPKK